MYIFLSYLVFQSDNMILTIFQCFLVNDEWFPFQMALLDGMTRDDLLLDCKVTWVPILEKDTPETGTFANLKSL